MTGEQRGSNPIKILHVDDDHSFLEVAKEILETDEEFSVTSSSSGDEALLLVQRGGYDIVLSDYRMIRMDGVVLLEKIRLIDPDMPFIFFSGKEKEEGFLKSLDSATWFIQKCGEPGKLFATLADQIRASTRSSKSR